MSHRGLFGEWTVLLDKDYEFRSSVQCPMSWPRSLANTILLWPLSKISGASANHYSLLHCFCPPATENYSDSRQVGAWLGRCWLVATKGWGLRQKRGEHSADIGLSQSPRYLDLSLPAQPIFSDNCLLYSGFTVVEICVIWRGNLF